MPVRALCSERFGGVLPLDYSYSLARHSVLHSVLRLPSHIVISIVLGLTCGTLNIAFDGVYFVPLVYHVVALCAALTTLHHRGQAR